MAARCTSTAGPASPAWSAPPRSPPGYPTAASSTGAPPARRRADGRDGSEVPAAPVAPAEVADRAVVSAPVAATTVPTTAVPTAAIPAAVAATEVPGAQHVRLPGVVAGLPGL